MLFPFWVFPFLVVFNVRAEPELCRITDTAAQTLMVTGSALPETVTSGKQCRPATSCSMTSVEIYFKHEVSRLK
jgi:hypothetical protein